MVRSHSLYPIELRGLRDHCTAKNFIGSPALTERGASLRNLPEEIHRATRLGSDVIIKPMDEWAVQFDDEESIFRLRRALRHSWWQENMPPGSKHIFLLVDRFKGLKIEVFSKEHPPPHFRVSFSGESANYRISDCEQLNGGLGRHCSVIKEWHAENKPKLIEIWDARRPTDCPVGAYRE